MSDETMAEAGAASESHESAPPEDAPRAHTPNAAPAPSLDVERSASDAPAAASDDGDRDREDSDGGPQGPPALGPDGLPRKRRRRGSRGGRNRRPSNGAGGSPDGQSVESGGPDDADG